MQTDATLTEAPASADAAWAPFRRIRLAAPRIAAGLSAGRFVLADLGNYLRTPLFPAHLHRESFEVLVASDHPLAALPVGAQCNLIGPLGRGYQVPDQAGRLLLVADVPHLPVLLPLIHQQPGVFEKSSVSVALLLSANTASELYPIHLLPPSLEVRIATGDGSVGHTGSVLDLLPDVVYWADRIRGDAAASPRIQKYTRLWPAQAIPHHGATHFAVECVAPRTSPLCASHLALRR